MAAATSFSTVTGLRIQSPRTVAPTKSVAASVRLGPVRASLENAGKALVAAGAALIIAAPAFALEIKMGADDGSLAFVPKAATAAKGELIVFKNNAGFPHNVVFDEDEVPEGVNAGAISHPGNFNAPGEKHEITLTVPGKYEYYCEPHLGGGMIGSITVS